MQRPLLQGLGFEGRGPMCKGMKLNPCLNHIQL